MASQARAPYLPACPMPSDTAALVSYRLSSPLYHRPDVYCYSHRQLAAVPSRRPLALICTIDGFGGRDRSQNLDESPKSLLFGVANHPATTGMFAIPSGVALRHTLSLVSWDSAVGLCPVQPAIWRASVDKRVEFYEKAIIVFYRIVVDQGRDSFSTLQARARGYS
jgi:hypothetical protein